MKGRESMNKKKIVSMLLSASIIMGSNTFVFAADMSSQSLKVSSIENKMTEGKDDVKVMPYKDNKTKVNIKIKEEAAKKIAKDAVKKYFQVEINNDFKCSVRQNNYDRLDKSKTYWNINWNLNNFESNVYIYVTVDANDGTITSININDYSKNGQTAVPTITFDEAVKISNEFVDEINKEKIKECKLQNTNWSNSAGYSNNYSFTYARMVNGVKFDSNKISVTVDGVTGKVTNYRYIWDEDLKIPSLTDVIGEKRADDIYKKDLKVDMVYERYRNKYEYQDAENKRNVKLVFKNTLENGTMIDAKTGEYINSYNNDNIKIETKQLSKKEIEEFYKKAEEIKKSKKPMEKEEAEEVVNKLIKGIYGKGFTIDNLYYNDNEYEENTSWYASFKKENKDRKISESGNIKIDALSGQIISSYKYNNDYKYDEKFKQVLTWEEGYYKAIDLLGNYYSDKIKNIELSQTHEIRINEDKDKNPERYYSYSFIRKVNGISYDNNKIRVQIDTKTGNVSNVSAYWEDDIVFESPKGNIGEEKVRKIFFNKYKPELAYKIQNISEDRNKPEWKVNLVYELKGVKPYYNFNDIDAFTGDFLNYDGEEINDNIEDFKKEIKGSKAERELSILACNGILDTKDFVLKKDVQKMDLIKALVDALGYRPYVVEDGVRGEMELSKTEMADENKAVESNKLSREDYLKMAKYYGFIDGDIKNFNEKEPVSREEMAKAFVKYLNYDSIAECDGIFALNYYDARQVRADLTGYVAIAEGLGLIEAESKKIRPKDTASIEELYLGLYNTLVNSSKKNIVPVLYK